MYFIHNSTTKARGICEGAVGLRILPRRDRPPSGFDCIATATGIMNIYMLH